MQASISIPGTRLVLGINEFTIEEAVNQVDMATLWVEKPQLLFEFQDSPVLVDIEAGVQSRTIAGYLDTGVSGSVAKSNASGAFFLLGAATKMRSGEARVWTSQRPFDIAKDIVTKYGFSLEMEKIPEKIPFFAQSGDSDWQTLVRLALDHGLVVIATNTVIRIVDPSMETRRLHRRHQFNFDVRHVDRYTMASSSTPIGFERRSFIGVDKFGETFEVIANPTSTISLHAPELVPSLGDALASKERLERRRHSRRSATITVGPNPHARSGASVTLSNGYDARPWFVMEARHTKSGEAQSTSLVLCRDDGDRRGAIPVFGNQKWPQPVLAGGNWRSSTQWMREL